MGDLSLSSSQSVRQLTDIFFETSMKLADQWARTIDSNHGQETEIEVTNWAGRFAYAFLYALLNASLMISKGLIQ
jgi:hypothetical protein